MVSPQWYHHWLDQTHLARPIEATRVLLYDRPNLDDQVLAGKLTFTDDTSLPVRELPNDDKKPLTLSFPEKNHMAPLPNHEIEPNNKVRRSV